MNKPITAMPKYAEYKESGVDWLGEIPAGWGVKRLKHYGQMYAGLTGKNGSDFNKEPQAGYSPFVPFTSIANGNIVKSSRQYVRVSNFEQQNTISFGDILFLMSSETIEDIGKNSIFLEKIETPFLNSFCKGFRLNKAGLQPAFVNYLLQSDVYRSYFSKVARGFTRINLKQKFISSAEIVLPPLPEQTAIAKFLDDKVAKIEALVGIKRRQIELLAERKQILIQNAVTQGLNPDAPMKESGVNWIGEIPAHWEVKRNAILFQERKDAGNEKLPVLSVSIHSGVSTKELSEDENIRSTIKIQDRTAYKEVLSGYIAYNMMRAWQGGIGAVKVHGMVSPAYVVAKPIKNLDSEYFELLYRTPAFIWQMDSYSRGITDFRKRLYWEGFRELITIAPPIKEQQEIIEICALESIKIDETITLKQNQIEKLTEYKTTLINAAVTGKIKVAGE